MKWVDDVGAKTFPKYSTNYNVVDFGAIGDGKTLNTEAIQNAINECYENGGGKVIFDKGKYLTGSIFVKEGVDLHIDEGVEILGSQNIKNYPEIDTRVAGIEMVWPASLIMFWDKKMQLFQEKEVFLPKEYHFGIYTGKCVKMNTNLKV